MGNTKSEPIEHPHGLLWLERGAKVLCLTMLLAAGFIFSIGACQFNYGASPDAVSSGLNTMSNGILAALVGVTGYTCFFAVGLLVASFTEQDSSQESA